MAKKYKKIETIGKKARLLDLVQLELPAMAQACVSFSGMDRISGYFCGVKDRKVLLARTQKGVYNSGELRKYPFRDIASYEIIRRYVPKPGEDGLDELLQSTLFA
jgi:hypothetical protein